MRLRIAAAGGDGAGDADGGAELRELCEWLRTDEDGPDEVRLSTRTGGTAGGMGPVEVIDLVLTHTVAFANLAVVYAGWWKSRVQRTPSAGFTFTRDSDGLTVTVSGEDGSEEAVRRLLAVLAEPQPPAVQPPAVEPPAVEPPAVEPPTVQPPAVE